MRKSIFWIVLTTAFLILAELQFVPAEFVYRYFVHARARADIIDLTGYTTGKIGQEDISFGSGAATDTFTVSRYKGFTVTLTKLPSLYTNIASIIKGQWYIAAVSGDQCDDTVEGSLAWVVDIVGDDKSNIIIPGDQNYTCETNLEIPKNIIVKYYNGARFTLGAGITFTHSGTLDATDTNGIIFQGAASGGTKTLAINGRIRAGRYQIFGDNITIAGTPIVDAIYPEWFGAVADGVTDDAPAIQAAFDLSGSVEFDGGKDYLISSGITVTGKNIAVRSSNGQRVTILPKGAFNVFIFRGKAHGDSTTLASNAQFNQSNITVADSTGFKVGQMIKMKSSFATGPWYYDNRGKATKGEIHIIKSIDGNDITFEHGLFDSYDVSNGEAVTITNYDHIEAIIRDIILSYPINSNIGGMGVYYCSNVLIDNVKVENSAISGIGILNGYKVAITNSQVKNINADGTGYGISIGESEFVTIDNLDATGCRVGVDFTGQIPSREGLVKNSHVSASGLTLTGADLFSSGLSRGFGTHGAAELITFENNTMENVWTGIVSRGVDINIIGNTFKGLMQRGIQIAYGEKVRILNNIANPNNFHNTYLSVAKAKLYGHMKIFVEILDHVKDKGNFEIQGNHGTVHNAFLKIESGSYSALDIRNNSFTLDNNNAANNVNFIIGKDTGAGDPIIIQSSIIRDNQLVIGAGVYSHVVGVTITPEYVGAR